MSKSAREIELEFINNNRIQRYDRSEGSVIYGLSEPFSLEASSLYNSIDLLNNNTSILTAVGESLDKLAANYSITREQATKAIRIGTFTSGITIPEAALFNDATGLEYKFTSPNKLECQTAGTSGNLYYGNITAQITIQGLTTAQITGTLTPGEDVETDDSLRERILNKIQKPSFAGNVPAWREYMESQEGVSKCKVVPCKSGPGTVGLIISPITSAEGIAVLQAKAEEYAPIGCLPTVESVTNKTVNVYIKLESSKSVAELQTPVENVIRNYFIEINNNFPADLRVLRAFISYLVLNNVSVITNILQVKLNGQDADISLLSNEVVNMGTVTLEKL